MPEVKKLVRKKNRVWRNKNIPGKTFSGSYEYIWNKKTNEHERLLCMVEIGTKPIKKNSHFFDSPEAAKKVGWKGSDK